MGIASTDHWAAAEGGRIFLRRWSGEASLGCPIVLLHDSLGCVELWREFPELLSECTGREVIAYDRPGYGRSDALDALPGDDIVESEAQVVLQLADQLGIDAFVVFGHSIGGEMAVACGSRLPRRCVGVIAESAQTWLEEMTLAAIAFARAQFSDPEQMQRLAKYHGAKAQWVLDAWTETWFLPSMRNWSIAPELPNLRCPLLAIHGDRDDFSSLEQPRCMVSMAGGPARLEILSDCGHLPHREQPETVLRLVAEFCRALP